MPGVRKKHAVLLSVGVVAIAVTLAVVVWLLNVLGLMDSMRSIRIGR